MRKPMFQVESALHLWLLDPWSQSTIGQKIQKNLLSVQEQVEFFLDSLKMQHNNHFHGIYIVSGTMSS